MNEVAGARRAVSASALYPRVVFTRSRWRVVLLTVAVVGSLAAFGWSREQSRPTVATTVAEHAPSVSGVVVQEGGPPPLPGEPNARPLRFLPLLVSGATIAGSRLHRYLLTDGEGRFALTLPPGIYRVTALISSPLSNGPAATVRVRPGHRLRIRLTSYVV